jgi:hypothetical protein
VLYSLQDHLETGTHDLDQPVLAGAKNSDSDHRGSPPGCARVRTKVQRKDQCWSVGLVCGPRELSGVTTIMPGVARVLLSSPSTLIDGTLPEFSSTMTANPKSFSFQPSKKWALTESN